MRVLALASCFVCTVGCGRLRFAAGDDAGGSPDSACALPALSLGAVPVMPFGAPTLIPELDSPAFDDDPTLTGDQLEIYFQSGRSGTARVWRSTRATNVDMWSAPTPVVELDAFMPNTPEVSRDGLRLRFDVAGDIYLTTRPDRTSPWQSPMLVPALATGDVETGAVDFLDGAGVAFFSTRPGGDLWEMLRDPVDCAFAAPRVLPGAAGTGIMANLWMRNDGLAVAYQGPGMGGNGDISVAERPDLESPFGVAIEQTTIGSAGNDDDPWLDDTMTTIYFASARTGDSAIYFAMR